MFNRLTYKYIANFGTLVFCFAVLFSSTFTAVAKKAKKDTTLAAPASFAPAPADKDSAIHHIPGVSKDAVEAAVDYSAEDSAIFNMGGVVFLYGNAKVSYQKMELTSSIIRLRMDSSLVQARGSLDSAGHMVGTPVFKDGNDQYESKAIDYNFKSQKWLIRGVMTQQGDGYITSEKAKKQNDGTFQMVNGKYTTCDDHDHPHYYLDLTRAKVQPKSYVVTGPAYLVLLDVPLPLVIPFGYFPFTSNYSSGLLMPSFGQENRRGFYLRNGGYYFALNDKVDLALRGDVYSKGSWALNGTSRYAKRYKYNGRLYASYQKTIYGEDHNLPDYAEMEDIKLTWKHQQDAKANPFSTFSASVDYASSSYNKNNVDSYYNTATYAENNKSSSVNYSLNIPNTPLSVSTNATLNQRRSDSTITLSLPNVYFNMSRLYPFKSSSQVGKDKWYDKIYLSYNMDFNNQYSTKENDFDISKIFSDGNNGFKHSFTTGASYTFLKYFVATPSISYNERWYFNKYQRHWNEADSTVVLDTTKGFYRVYDVSSALNLSTQLYGFWKPVFFRNKISMIRHVFRPTVGFSWVPVIDNNNMGNYSRLLPGTNTYNKVDYNYYSGSLFGTSTEQDQGYLNFSVNNNVEMKVRSDKDSTGFRKISLIDNLVASTSYNMFADSLKWSDINTSVRFKVTKQVSITVQALFTPYTYQLNSYGSPVKCNVTEWDKNHRLARMRSAQTSFGYTFSSDMFSKDKKSHVDANTNETNDPNGFTPAQEAKKQEAKKGDEDVDADGYQKFSMPWQFRFDYSVEYADYEFNKKKLTYKQELTHSLNFSGNVQFSKNWSANFSSGWDFEEKDFSYTSVGVTRDLHCWQASINLVPFGSNFSYNFHIGVRSSILQDLKYEQRKNYSDYPVWGDTWY